MKLKDMINMLFDVSSDVPEFEKEFYSNQCTGRNMYIGKVDKEETKRLRKETKKLQKREKRSQKEDTTIKRIKKGKHKFGNVQESQVFGHWF